MSDNPAKHEVPIKQYLRSILDIEKNTKKITKDSQKTNLMIPFLSLLIYFHQYCQLLPFVLPIFFHGHVATQNDKLEMAWPLIAGGIRERAKFSGGAAFFSLYSRSRFCHQNRGTRARNPTSCAG